MGADLYIESISEPAAKAAKPAFDEACQRRDKRRDMLRADGLSREAIGNDAEVKAAQDDVDKAYNAMYPEDGYFRDSYNVSSVLNKCGLSWWRDVTPMLRNGKLSPKKAALLAERIEKAPLHLPTLAELEHDNADTKNGVESWHDYYRNKRTRLIAFLRRAVELKEPIRCSL